MDNTNEVKKSMMKKQVKVNERLYDNLMNPTEMMYKDQKFLSNYRRILMAKTLLDEEMDKVMEKVRSKQVLELLGGVSEIIENMF